MKNKKAFMMGNFDMTYHYYFQHRHIFLIYFKIAMLKFLKTNDKQKEKQMDRRNSKDAEKDIISVECFVW